MAHSIISGSKQGFSNFGPNRRETTVSSSPGRTILHSTVPITPPHAVRLAQVSPKIDVNRRRTNRNETGLFFVDLIELYGGQLLWGGRGPGFESPRSDHFFFFRPRNAQDCSCPFPFLNAEPVVPVNLLHRSRIGSYYSSHIPDCFAFPEQPRSRSVSKHMGRYIRA